MVVVASVLRSQSTRRNPEPDLLQMVRAPPSPNFNSTLQFYFLSASVFRDLFCYIIVARLHLGLPVLDQVYSAYPRDKYYVIPGSRRYSKVLRSRI